MVFSTYTHLILTTSQLTYLQTLYHVLNAYSEQVARVMLKLDYLGIIINIASTCATCTWFGLLSNPYFRTAYLLFFMSLSAVIFILLLVSKVDGRRAKQQRYVSNDYDATDLRIK
jgi:adiponectin receptor